MTPITRIDGATIGDGTVGDVAKRLRRLYIEAAQHNERATPRIDPLSNDKKQNLQDAFLNAVRKARTPLTIFLVNGVKLQAW